LSDLAEILHVTHTKVRGGLRASKLEPEVEFRRQEAFFQIPFWGHTYTADQDIGMYIDNGVPNMRNGQIGFPPQSKMADGGHLELFESL